MSLDIYFYSPGECGSPGSGIFIREEGQTRQITEAEWDHRHPDREPIRYPLAAREAPPYVWHGNITHNLARMAQAAGVYEALWAPMDLGASLAGELVRPLRAGLLKLEGDPEAFKAYNPKNGWGSYALLCAFIQECLAACERWPLATISVSA